MEGTFVVESVDPELDSYDGLTFHGVSELVQF